MLSGRYITDQLARHWTQNKAGKCLLPGCNQPNIGSLEHILLECSALNSTRQKMVSLCRHVGTNYLPVKNIIEAALSTQDPATCSAVDIEDTYHFYFISLIRGYGGASRHSHLISNIVLKASPYFLYPYEHMRSSRQGGRENINIPTTNDFFTLPHVRSQTRFSSQ